MKIEVKREELAWAAGFFDGEGCTYKSGTGMAPFISISQVDPAVLYRFQRAVFGLGKVYIGTKSYGTGRKPVHHFRTGKFEHVQAIMAAIWEFLGDIKRQQYMTLLAAYLPNARAPNKNNNSWSAKQKAWYLRNRRRILNVRNGDTP